MEILHRIHFFTFHGVFIHGCFICLCPHGIPWFAHRKHSMEFPRNGIAVFPWGLRGFPWNEYHLVFPRNIRGNPRTPHEITVVVPWKFRGILTVPKPRNSTWEKHTKTSMETPSWRPHIGANGVSWYPWKNGWKIKKRKHAKKSSFLNGWGGDRERRYADHIIQIYFRMHHFVVKFSSPQAARGHWPLTKILRTLVDSVEFSQKWIPRRISVRAFVSPADGRRGAERRQRV